MNNWIKWCGCKRHILTTGQINENKSCQLCQDEEHARNLQDRVKEAQKKEEK